MIQGLLAQPLMDTLQKALVATRTTSTENDALVQPSMDT